MSSGSSRDYIRILWGYGAYILGVIMEKKMETPGSETEPDHSRNSHDELNRCNDSTFRAQLCGYGSAGRFRET